MMMMTMTMDDQDEAFVCKDLIKGKRSKRPRQPSPLSLAMCSSTTTTLGTTSSDDSRGFEEDDQDMANCLIFLARGGQTREFPPQPVSVVRATTDVHQCKTCDRSFTSFQALGGHRASHYKKPKVVSNEENNKGLNNVHAHPSVNNNMMNTTLSLGVTNKPVLALGHNNIIKVPKVHECLMCGTEFSSGQALGGHMRRHRTLTNVATTTTTTTTTTTAATTIVGKRIVRPELSEDKSMKQRTILQLDLNLPAPEEDQHQTDITKFSFASKQEKLLLFSASSLVDCHY